MRKHFKGLYISIVFLLFGFMLGCNANRHYVENNIIESSEENPSLYKEDYEHLLELLQLYYPYYTWLVEETNFLSLYEEKKVTIGSITDPYEFGKAINDLLAVADSVGHLSVLSKEHYMIYVNNIDDYSDMYCQDDKVALFSDSAKNYYATFPENGKQNKIENLVTYYPELDSIVFEIKSFSGSIDEGGNNLINENLEKYPDVSNIVFDIRGNRRGSDLYWIKNIVEPIGGNNTWVQTLRCKDNLYTRRNYDSFWENAYKVSDEEYEMISKTDISSEVTSWTDKNRWILVDENVYYAADSFVNFCKISHWAKIIGTKTKGNGIGQTPSLFLLPKSGVIIRFSTMYGINADGVNSDLNGTKPDFYTIKKESALELYKRIIKEVNVDDITD